MLPNYYRWPLRVLLQINSEFYLIAPKRSNLEAVARMV